MYNNPLDFKAIEKPFLEKPKKKKYPLETLFPSSVSLSIFVIVMDYTHEIHKY